MSMADEIRKLAELRESGALSEEEFAEAKAAVLAGGTSLGSAPTPTTVARETPQSTGADRSLGRAANRYITFKIVMAFVVLALMAAFFFGLFLPQWNKAQKDFDKARQQFQQEWEKHR